ncbi:TPA: restriction endonuclease subunit S [Vibrio parahaemolyticus]|nr:restriction endonuclease subunit S [Vibrio parahaemolyticus]
MGFEVKSIGEVCSVGDGAHSKVTRVETGIPYLTSKNIGQGFLKLDKLDYISEESFEKLFSKDSKATRRPQAGDVLFGIIGSFGNTYLYKESDFFGFSSSIGILRPNPELLDSEYLYYVVSSKKFRDNHANHNSGSVQGYTNIPTVKGLPLPVPSIAVQKKIAKVLQSLDRKIAVNQQTNQTLEAMAQAIFKSWFVDFDPVKAKMRGEQPEGMDEATASLFPDKLVESELGLIPEGWEVCLLNQKSEIKYGKNLPKTKLLDEGYPVFGGNGVIGYYSSYLYEDEQVLVSCRGAASGKVLRSLPKSFITNNSLVIDLSNSVLNINYVEPYLKGCNLEEYTSGSAQPQMTVANMAPVQILVPSEDILKSFDEVVKPLKSKIRANERQNLSLAALRDTLLPKLLSGEIELGQAQELAEVE